MFFLLLECTSLTYSSAGLPTIHNPPPTPNPRWQDHDPASYQQDHNLPCDLGTRWSHNFSCNSSMQWSHDYLCNLSMQQNYNPTYPYDCNHTQAPPNAPKPKYETRSVCFTDLPPKPSAQEDKEIEELVLKMLNLSVHDPAYTVLYAQISYHFPNAAKPLPPPNFGQTATVAYHTPTNHPSNTITQHPQSQQAQTTPLSNKVASFFGKAARTDRCAFCTHQGHIVHRCPTAEEYICFSHALVRNG